MRAIDFGILLGLAYQTFTDDLRRSLADKGFDDLGSTYGYVFRALADEALSQRALAARLAMTDQGLAKIVAEMEARGYVDRQADPGDARVRRLRLAPRGRRALASARRFHAAYERGLTARFGPAAVQRFRELLLACAPAEAVDEAQARLRPM